MQYEPSPNLDYIKLITLPLTSYSISGKILQNNEAVENIKVLLEGKVSLTTQTDKNGNFSFKSLSVGSYYIRPMNLNFAATPYDYFIKELDAHNSQCTFFINHFPEESENTLELKLSGWKIECDTLSGLINLYKDDNQLLKNIYAL